MKRRLLAVILEVGLIAVQGTAYGIDFVEKNPPVGHLHEPDDTLFRRRGVLLMKIF